MLAMDYSSFRSLQIFQTESHPSMHGIGVSKEGISLFALFSNTFSGMGKKLMRFLLIYEYYFFLRQWFSRPLCSIEDIVMRHQTVDFFLRYLVNANSQTTNKKVEHSSTATNFYPYSSSHFVDSYPSISHVNLIQGREKMKQLCCLITQIKPLNQSIVSIQKGIFSKTMIEMMLRVCF
jgi:hypothetical protein